MKVRLCELCPSEAAVFCPSDAAFLCWSCDAKIHEANFLVARHVRRSICKEVSGESVCMSSSSTKEKSECCWRKKAEEEEGILVKWCGKLGMEPVELGVEKGWRVLPFRVRLAASMWLALKKKKKKNKSVVLKRLEQISGVPGKLILAAASKLKLDTKHHLQEGWAETDGSHLTQP